MRKKIIGFALAFFLFAATPVALANEIPTDDGKVGDNFPVLLKDPGHGDAC